MSFPDILLSTALLRPFDLTPDERSERLSLTLHTQGTVAAVSIDSGAGGAVHVGMQRVNLPRPLGKSLISGQMGGSGGLLRLLLLLLLLLAAVSIHRGRRPLRLCSRLRLR